MNRTLAIIALTASLFVTLEPQTPTSTKPKTPSLSFTERVLKFLGISSSPGTLKGPNDEIQAGELWLADLESKHTRRLADGRGYRSPIFLVPSADILTLHGNDIVRLSLTTLEPKKLCSVDGLLKLLGASPDEPDTVLILLRSDTGAHPHVGLLNINTGAVTNLPYDHNSEHDLQTVEDLSGWRRTYGDRQLFVERETKTGYVSTTEWLDVFLVTGDGTPVNVSHCDGDNCGQPSLSPDGHYVAFVRSRTE